jgi:hypothetical protein
MKSVTKYAVALVLACGITSGAFAQSAPQAASTRDVLQAYNAAADYSERTFNEALKTAGDDFKANEDKAGIAKKAAIKPAQEAHDSVLKQAVEIRNGSTSVADQERDAALNKSQSQYDEQRLEALRIFHTVERAAAETRNESLKGWFVGSSAREAAQKAFDHAVSQAQADYAAKAQSLDETRYKQIDQIQDIWQTAVDKARAISDAAIEQADKELKIATRPADDAYVLAIMPGVYAGFEDLKKARQAEDELRTKRVLFWNAYNAKLITADEAVAELNKLVK